MDPNLQYWQNNGQSFLSRLGLWSKILDPTLLLSQAEIEEARTLIQNEENTPGKNDKVSNAWLLSLSSVHSDTGAVISPAYRPQVFLPISAPLVVGSLIAHKGIKSAMFWQFVLHTYCAGFNHANRNATATKDNKTTMKQSLLILGAVSYSTVTGIKGPVIHPAQFSIDQNKANLLSSTERALPQIILQRLRLISSLTQTICRSFLPVPLAAGLAAFNIMVVRSEEAENGISLFDANGNAVGVSKEAGFKAVKETAISRATLFGTTAALPTFLMALLERAKFVQRNPRLIAPIGSMCTVITFGLMIPVSFSLFPQLGKIKKENLEKEFQSLDGNEELFYHRGL